MLKREIFNMAGGFHVLLDLPAVSLDESAKSRQNVERRDKLPIYKENVSLGHEAMWYLWQNGS